MPVGQGIAPRGLACVSILAVCFVGSLFRYYAESNTNEQHLPSGMCDSQHPATRHSATWTSRGCNRRSPKKWFSQFQEDLTMNRVFYNGIVCGGTFLEIGALDGVTFSNTKTFEDSFSWTGLLIEAHPGNYKNLAKNRPNTTKFHSATCMENQKAIEIAGGGAVGGDVSHITDFHANRFHIDTKKKIKVPCQPLYSMMRQSGIRAIDFFILDVEGAEYEVLKTMDWSTSVGVWIVEMNHQDPEKERNLFRTFAEHGYKHSLLQGMTDKNTIFVNPDYIKHVENITISKIPASALIIKS